VICELSKFEDFHFTTLYFWGFHFTAGHIFGFPLNRAVIFGDSYLTTYWMKNGRFPTLQPSSKTKLSAQA